MTMVVNKRGKAKQMILNGLLTKFFFDILSMKRVTVKRVSKLIEFCIILETKLVKIILDAVDKKITRYQGNVYKQ